MSSPLVLVPLGAREGLGRWVRLQFERQWRPSAGGLPAIGARADFEFGAEGVVEFGEIVGAAGERDLEDLIRLSRQAYGGLAQARAQKVLVRCYAGHPAEGAQEMEGAHSGGYPPTVIPKDFIFR